MDGFLKPENLTAILFVRVCHFAKEDFKRDLQVYEYLLHTEISVNQSKISLYWSEKTESSNILILDSDLASQFVKTRSFDVRIEMASKFLCESDFSTNRL